MNNIYDNISKISFETNEKELIFFKSLIHYRPGEKWKATRGKTLPASGPSFPIFPYEEEGQSKLGGAAEAIKARKNKHTSDSAEVTPMHLKAPKDCQHLVK